MHGHCPSKVKKWNWPCARRESVWRSGDRVWRIFILAPDRWVVSFIHRCLYLLARSPSLQLDVMLGGPRTRLDVLETRHISEPLFLGPGQKPSHYTDYAVWVIVVLPAVHVSAVGSCVFAGDAVPERHSTLPLRFFIDEQFWLHF